MMAESGDSSHSVRSGGAIPKSKATARPPARSTDGRTSGRGLMERLSTYGVHVMPGAFARRSRFQREGAVSDSGAPSGVSTGGTERSSLTPAMRKTYLKELLLKTNSQSGLSGVLSQDTEWALYPMEHAWMLSAVDGNYETMLEFIEEDPYLLTRKDFISGFSVLHWLAKRGQDDSLVKLLKHAESVGVRVDVNLKGSGGLTPLHVASMHGQYMVVKLLVGAFGANVDAMDYSGRRAWQYLQGDAPLEMKELLGTWDEEQNVNNNAVGSKTPTVEAAAGDKAQRDELDSSDSTARGGSWRLGSFFSSFSLFRNKS